MSAIGETLRRERVKRNLDLEQISRELKISLKFLQAIEAEQFEKLPGIVFARSFVRQYARLLGLDEEELAGQVQRAFEPSPGVPQFVQQPKLAPVDIPLPRVETWQTVGDKRQWSSSLPALALFVVVLLVCSGAYAWWQRQRSLVSAHQETQTPVPAQTAEVPAVTPAAPVPSPAPRQAAPAQVSPSNTSPGSAPDRSPVQTASTGAAQPGDPTKAAAPEAPRQPPPNPNATVRVEVTADETVWVLARADDKYMFSGTLEARQSRTVEATDKVLLRLGNAGGVTITLNGKPIGSVGPKGQVRTVQFTSGGFQIVAAPPKPSLPLDEDIF